MFVETGIVGAVGCKGHMGAGGKQEGACHGQEVEHARRTGTV